jgi:type VI secretion system protein ImpL
MMALYIVLGLAAVALVVLTIIYFRNKKKAKAAAAADAGQAPGGDEISVLIHEAERKLASAKLGQSARVGNLPVFIVMGDAGTTKTSVMLHSGLEPELVAGQVYQAGNVTPTRGANFWFSRRSIFVELGGQLLADGNRFRNAAKRLQPRSSVVGKGEQAARAAVVCFDCENFTKPGAMDFVGNAARNLRARLGEISQAMGIDLPVYALFTKIDRLPFFADYVRNLNNEEATQVLGVTLPMMKGRGEGVYAEQEAARLTASFEQLFRSLADGRPEFLSRESDAGKLPGAYEFPREFRKVRPALVQFLVDLCRPSQLSVGPFLRGFYFTGVRPVIINEAAPVAPAAASQPASYGAGAAGATGIFNPRAAQPAAAQPAAPPVLSTRKVPQWVFLSHFFNDVLLADKAAMGASGASTKVSGARRILYIAAASLCFLLTVFFTISFFKNLGIESRMKAAARGIPATELQPMEFAPLPSLQKLDAMRSELQTLAKYRRDGAPFFYKWGLYYGDEVYRTARPVYCSRFRQLLLKQTQANMLTYLHGLPSSNAEYRPAYEALRSYLITTSHPEKSDDQLAPALMRFWQNDRTPDTDRATLARAQFDFYQQDLLEPNPCTAGADAVAVGGAQAYLKRLGGAQRVYQGMLSEANKKFHPVNFNKQFPGSEKTLLDNYDVPGAFTKDGWKFMTEAIAHPDRYVKGEAWVLGGDDGGPPPDLAKLSQEIKGFYLADFLKEWRTYIRSGRVQKYADLKDASEKLQTLSGNQSTLLQMIALASQNTAVEDPAVTAVFQPVHAVVPPTNMDRLIAPQNQPYMGSLGQLQLSIDAAANQPPPNDAQKAATRGVAAQAIGTTRTLAQSFSLDKEGHVEQQVQRLLEEPITNTDALTKPPDMAADLNKKGAGLCKQMRPLWDRFPFNPNSRTDATLDEVNAVFKPKDGAIAQFVDANLKKDGGNFVPASGGTAQLTPAFAQFMKRAADFADALYKDGSSNPHFTYTVKAMPTTYDERVDLVVDGQTASFAGPGSKPFTWTGNPQSTTQLKIKIKGGGDHAFPIYNGLWSIFHFVYESDRYSGSQIHRISGSGVPLRAIPDSVTGQIVETDMEFSSTPPVFEKGYFSTLGCVATVAR